MKTPIGFSVKLIAAACVLALAPLAIGTAVASPGKAGAPAFRVDPSWPKPLPHHWQIGQVAGIAVDQYDHIWIIQRPRTLTDDEAWATDAYTQGCSDGTLPDPGTGLCSDGSTPVAVDAFGHPRPFGPEADCCVPAPAVMEFDTRGNLLRAWGGPVQRDPDWGWPAANCLPDDGCQWPANEHGIYVDHNGFVYIAGNGFGDGTLANGLNDRGWDGQVLKFSMDGTFLLQVGAAGAGPSSNDTDGGLNGTPQLYRPADMEVDPETNELYIADGYGNHRVVVVDAATGQYKRHWGAYGQNPVDDAAASAVGAYGTDRDAGVTPPYFRNPVHCVHIAHDGGVYVCDRTNDRIQVFDKTAVGDVCDNSGQQEDQCGFITEKFVEADTLGIGTVADLDTSADRDQSCLHNADITNQRVDTLDRASLEILGQFGRNGRQAGQFHWLHNLATDSRGNIYTAEVDTAKRAQKFVRMGPLGCNANTGGRHHGHGPWDADARNSRW